MNQKDFLEQLEKRLATLHVNAADEILEDYRDHFTGKLADGYVEAEISARLGDPTEIAMQYQTLPAGVSPAYPARPLVLCGLILLDIIVFSLLISFWAWTLALGSISVGVLASALLVATGTGIGIVIPYIPLAGSLALAVSLIALAVLSAAGTGYSYRLSIAVLKSYLRFHRRSLTRKGQPKPPSLAAVPSFSPKARRVMRRLVGIGFLVFGISFVLGYLILALTAGNYEFWHVWGWFV